jgi:hypothetical protein
MEKRKTGENLKTMTEVFIDNQMRVGEDGDDRFGDIN